MKIEEGGVMRGNKGWRSKEERRRNKGEVENKQFQISFKIKEFLN